MEASGRAALKRSLDIINNLLDGLELDASPDRRP
jgi:hypothetical protein